MAGFRQEVKRLLRSLGYDVARHTIQNSPGAQLQRMLLTLGVNLVLDIGANEGHYGRSLRHWGYAAKIVSFEPLAAAHARLLEATLKDPSWKVADRTALGDTEGQIEMHVAANSASSSILAMLPAHQRAAPHARPVAIETVPIARLDHAAEAYVRDDDVVWVKIDTQGYEAKVLSGAVRMVARAAALQLELSLVPLYDGQPLILEMIDLVRGLGFELHAILPEFVDPESGRTLQVDGIFVRKQT